MPTKRRRGKARRVLHGFAPLAAWRMAFRAGYDYLRQLQPYGIAGDAAVHAAMPAAWKRLGLEFLATYPNAQAAWALERFGHPCEVRHAS